MQRELLVGLVGAGWAAREHCISLARVGGARVAGVVDVAPESAERLAAEFGGHVCESVEELLNANGLDAIVVATPSGLHREAVVPALEQGIATFVEKPLARSMADADAIVKAAEKTGAICAVGYQWRALNEMLQMGTSFAAQPIALMISSGIGVTQSRPWFDDGQLSGGVLFERVSHHIDIQRMLAGEVRSVSAVSGDVSLSGLASSLDECDDVLSLTLVFASGAVGAVHVVSTPSDYPTTQSLRILTTTGTYDLELDPAFVLRAQADDESGTGQWRAEEEPFLRQMRRFLLAAQEGDQSLVCCTPSDAAETLRVATAAERSLSQNVIMTLK